MVRFQARGLDEEAIDIMSLLLTVFFERETCFELPGSKRQVQDVWAPDLRLLQEHNRRLVFR